MTVTLRPAGESDLPFLYRLTSDPESTGDFQWYGWQDPHRLRRRWEVDGLLGDEDGLLIIVADGDDAGLVSWRKAFTGRVVYGWAMGVIVAPESRGKGHGTEAQKLLVRYLFDHSTVNRVEATTEITNLAEQRALEKAGFTREGVMRGAGFRAGEWHDGVMYSVIRSDLSPPA
ncbi:GNAT family N-acetyltransferase [Nonomuraea sp. NPDC002799]